MRAPALLLLGLLVLAGPTGALSLHLHAPAVAPTDGTPLEVGVRVEGLEGPAELKLWLGGESWQASRTWDGKGWTRSDWYVVELAPDDSGGWTGWVPVRANPGSTQHDRLLSLETALLGARVRTGDQRAEATEVVELVHEPELRPVALAPGQAVEARQGDVLVAHRSHPATARSTVVEVALPPGYQGSLCVEEACQAEPGLRLAAASRTLAVVENTGSRAARLAGAVVVLDEGRCPVGGVLEPGQRRVVATEDPPEGSGLVVDAGCDPAGPGSGQAQLFQLGRPVDALEPPSWGWRVRDPIRQGAPVPWLLPVGTWPAPLDTEPVAGWVHPFETATDGLETVLQVIDGARQRLTVATYLLTHHVVAHALARAAGRGVDVHVVLEPQPVGGLPERTEPLVALLEDAGVTVERATGPWSVRGVQHAKLVVADGAVALVLTENMTHSGLPEPGRQGNVGWGLGVANTSLARRLEALFVEPAASAPWTPEGWSPFQGSVTVVTTPENAWRREGIPAAIEASTGPVAGLVLLAGTRWGPEPNPWLEALVNASARVPVRVLLNGAGFHGRTDASNLETAAHLRAHPAAGDLTVRLSDPAGPRVHAKGLVGQDWVYVGSSNWGAGGALLNREVGLLVEDERLAGFFAEAHERAWKGEEERTRPAPASPAACVGVVLTLAALRVRVRGWWAGAP